MGARAEFTVEPFVAGNPGPHVTAAIEAVRTAGLEPDVGPFATAITGPTPVVTAAVASLIEAARSAGAGRISIHIAFDD